MVVEIIHDELAQIIGYRLRVQMVKQLLESLDMGIIPAMDDMLPDMKWNELYPAAPHEARTICTQCVFGIIDVDKCIREPAWVERGRGRQPMEYWNTLRKNACTHQTSIDPPG